MIPPGCDLFTEQELRRIDEEYYPKWVPVTSHRPDGWWLVANGQHQRLFALEVEMNVKEPGVYESLGAFYKKISHAVHVIWLANSHREANRILRRISKLPADSPTNHSFLLLDDFFNHGWQSPIRLGSFINTTLSSLLYPTDKTFRTQGSGMVLTDLRKKPMKSRISPTISFPEFYK